MLSYLYLFISVVTAYLVGSFPTSYLIAKYKKGFDIRHVGSQNAGATNVFRSVGKAAGLVTLLCDILKGFLVVTVIANFFSSLDLPLVDDFYRPMIGLVTVCGHVWPVFLQFRGGKGVATTIGVGLGLAPYTVMVCVVIWIGVFMLTKYVSLASIISLIAFPVIAAITGAHVYLIIFSVAICSLSIYKHKSNIVRLANGTENRISIFK
jgi:glycerol-3-phosphate acyltransferase PlsY